MTDGERFLSQNDVFAADLTDDDRETVEEYAEHHAGGLYVLWRDLGDGLSVKAHDDWGEGETAIVHVYDSENPDRDDVVFFTSGHQALEVFLAMNLDLAHALLGEDQ